MFTLPGYEDLSLIHEGHNSFVYQARRIEDQCLVILKLPKEAYLSPAGMDRYRQEYDILNSINHVEGVINAYAQTIHQGYLVTILAYFEGITLKAFLAQQEITLPQFFSIAIRLTEVLGEVHTAHIIHKDINPSNILINVATGALKLIDFGIATRLPRENPVLKNPTHLEGTLHYLSPEQTGRMNRSVDYRTDYYALGVIFYELLTQQLPFASEDVIELVHCHLAKRPILPSVLKPDLPAMISNIVMKLLEKTPEERYQSYRGLKTDLVTCQKQYEKGQFEPFNLGSQDFSDTFQLPQKLYGREKEIATLLSSLSQLDEGCCYMMCIAGYSGVGKTMLVRELYKPLTEKRGYFISGKFDQLQRNVPYSAIVNAFQDLMRQLLTETSAQLARWREKLLQALGRNAQVIVEVIPEVEIIIGTQPPVPSLGPLEAQNRFNWVFHNFVKVFCQATHPLVIFLDDLQWADVPSLKLIKLMLSENHHLFMIGAYRSNEVHPAHPLMLTLEEIQKAGIETDTMMLAPLDLVAIEQLVADTLHDSLENITPLAKLVSKKTNGNPFFINEFLKTLYGEGLLFFDPEMGKWQWDLTKIYAKDITDNVVELVAHKIRKLNEATQTVLKLASCIGNQFNPLMLSIIYEQPLQKTLADLWNAVMLELILPIAELDASTSYKFAHDRIQQAVYSLMPVEERAVIHRRVGQLLLQHTPAQEREQHIFTIVDQLNTGISLIEQQTERDELATLNLSAGKKAKSSAAYEPAFNYLKTGIALLGEQGWSKQYTLALDLRLEATEAAFLSGQFTQMDELITEILQYARSPLDKSRAYEIKIAAGMAQNRLPEAIRTGLTALRWFGLHFNERPSQFNIVLGMLEAKWYLLGKRVEQLADLPEMTDSYHLAIMRILTYLGTAAYMSNQDLLAVLTFKQVVLSVKYGNAPISPYAYAVYGLISCGVLGDIRTGFQFGELAERLANRSWAEKHWTKTIFVINTFVRHWKLHTRETLIPFLEAYQHGLETGDLEYAALSAFLYAGNSLVVGKPLPEVAKEMAKYREAIIQLNQKTSLQFLELWRQAVFNFQGENAKNPWYLNGKHYQEEEMLAIHRAANDETALGFVYLNKLMFCYLFKQHAQATQYIVSLKKHMKGLTGLVLTPVALFYESLNWIALYTETSNQIKRHYLLWRLFINQLRMKRWAFYSPTNHAHKYWLIKAEKARILGRKTVAIDAYEQAIELAQKHEYLQEEALANELAAKFWLEQQKPSLAKAYMRRAYECYQQWGGLRKMRDLEEDYPSLCCPASTAQTPEKPKSSVTQTLYQTLSTITTGTVTSNANFLDLASVIKASQAISNEIFLEKLLEKMMKIMLENTGAQKGFMILIEGDKITVEITAELDQVITTTKQSLPLEKAQDFLPCSLINYVIKTKEEIILDRATTDELFAKDNYISKHHIKSLLCVPILNQGQLVGVLYLENNLVSQAFTNERLEMVRLLFSQMAISIKNASFFQALQRSKLELQTALQSAQAANQAKTAFLNRMSHELRTPFNAILGYSEIVYEEAEEAGYDELLPDLQKIMTVSEQLLNIITDILDIAKIEAEELEIHPTEFPISELALKLTENIQPLLMEKRNQLLTPQLDDGLLYTDRLKVTKILSNILNNAAKFTHNGTVTLTAELSNSPTQTEASTTWVKFIIADTGIGIPAEKVTQIFEPFSQVDDSTTRAYGGVGLGLTLSQRFCQVLGGYITVKSELEKGTIFTIWLPTIFRESAKI